MTKKLHPAEQYVEQVLSGVIPACQWVKLACERYLSDKANALQMGWKFDPRSAQRSINFFERVLKHYQGEWAGKSFKLLPWQQFVIWNLDGWKNADGTRRFTQVSVFDPVKTEKQNWQPGAVCMQWATTANALPKFTVPQPTKTRLRSHLRELSTCLHSRTAYLKN